MQWASDGVLTVVTEVRVVPVHPMSVGSDQDIVKALPQQRLEVGHRLDEPSIFFDLVIAHGDKPMTSLGLRPAVAIHAAEGLYDITSMSV